MKEKDFTSLHELLERESARRNDRDELSLKRPDPLLVAREQKDARAILLCALFGYGNAGQIVKFLSSLDFTLLDKSEDRIRGGLKGKYYRFQSQKDVEEIFVTLSRMEAQEVEKVFMNGFDKKGTVLGGVFSLIEYMQRLNPYMSSGYRFLIGSVSKKPTSPYKRWMMFLRWMVRKDALDLGLWSGVEPSDLVIPLDTHTFQIGRKLGLLERKSYDWKAAVELTDSLRLFSPDDPLKYDFALYRIGQERLLEGSS